MNGHEQRQESAQKSVRHPPVSAEMLILLSKRDSKDALQDETRLPDSVSTVSTELDRLLLSAQKMLTAPPAAGDAQIEALFDAYEDETKFLELFRENVDEKQFQTIVADPPVELFLTDVSLRRKAADAWWPHRF